jgi:prolyl oligopeptidase
VDAYHGVDIADPYRWLEDADSAETAEWVAAQNAVTFAYLEGMPEREAFKQRLRRLWDYERYGVPQRRGGRYLLSKNDGLQNQAALYTLDALDAEPRLLLDPNALSDDGTVALSGTSISDDGRLLAYSLASAGSDWVEWRVRNVESGEDLPDRLLWSKFGGAAWSPDGSGFYYNRYEEPDGGVYVAVNYHQKVYHHLLGTPQSDDVLVYERPQDREWMFGAHVTEDGRYLLLNVSKDTGRRNAVFYRDLAADGAGFVELLPEFDAEYSYVANNGPEFLFQTNLDAPRGRVISIDLRRPERDAWVEVIPEGEEAIEGVSAVGDTLFVKCLRDAHARIRLHAMDGAYLEDVALPGLGSAGGFDGLRSDSETFYAYTSFTAPMTIYRFDLAARKSEVFRRPVVDFDPDAYEVTQEFYSSKDGARVPMFITHKKGLERNGNNPTVLYGYGGFSASLTPFFSVVNLAWMERGGVFAMPNLRGGGEYGEEWHLAGTKLKKQNVFDDFIAAAEHLIAAGYTRPSQLAISGGSNGGLLVGACLTQRPDLFGAALPAVGVMDMLRFQKFTIGWAWVSDYGSSDDGEEFRALLAYSPLHNIRPGAVYPATLITTGDHDDRVAPAHSFKFAAALQAAQAGPAPVLIRVETRAGHGAGKPTEKIIEESADRYAFLLHELG